MTDLEITRLCALAMGYKEQPMRMAPPCPWPTGIRVSEGKKAAHWYSPLDDNAQAMALVKKFPFETVNAMCLHLIEPVFDWNRVISERVAEYQTGERK